MERGPNLVKLGTKRMDAHESKGSCLGIELYSLSQFDLTDFHLHKDVPG